MTLSELHEYLVSGGSIVCSSPQQRNALAQFIQDELGFPIGPGTTDYLARHPNSTSHLIVELFTRNGVKVVSFCANGLGRTIPYNVVSHLLSSSGARLDDRTDEEFMEAFAELMG